MGSASTGRAPQQLTELPFKCLNAASNKNHIQFNSTPTKADKKSLKMEAISITTIQKYFTPTSLWLNKRFHLSCLNSPPVVL